MRATPTGQYSVASGTGFVGDVPREWLVPAFGAFSVVYKLDYPACSAGK